MVTVAHRTHRCNGFADCNLFRPRPEKDFPENTLWKNFKNKKLWGSKWFPRFIDAGTAGRWAAPEPSAPART